MALGQKKWPIFVAFLFLGIVLIPFQNCAPYRIEHPLSSVAPSPTPTPSTNIPQFFVTAGSLEAEACGWTNANPTQPASMRELIRIIYWLTPVDKRKLDSDVCSPSFTDVSCTDSDWAKIETLNSILPFGDCDPNQVGTQFCPETIPNKAVAAASFYSVWTARTPAQAICIPGVPSFPDLPTTSPYYEAVETLVCRMNEGATKLACDLGLFCPSNSLTRKLAQSLTEAVLGKILCGIDFTSDALSGPSELGGQRGN